MREDFSMLYPQGFQSDSAPRMPAFIHTSIAICDSVLLMNPRRMKDRSAQN